jgi:protein-S-isoprenylcysteine O-methyltransferase Ste14
MPSLERFALPSLVVLAAFLAFVWPILRLWRRERVWAVALPRRLALPERAIFVSMLIAFSSIGLWTTAFALRGPAGMHLWPASRELGAVGWGFALLGLGLMIIAQAQMGRSWRIGIDAAPTALVTRGLYRWVRNPIYTGLLVTTAGLLGIAPCAFTLVVACVAPLLIAVQARLEERHLLTVHGPSYRAYAARVGRFLPGIGRLPPAAAGA